MRKKSKYTPKDIEDISDSVELKPQDLAGLLDVTEYTAKQRIMNGLIKSKCVGVRSYKGNRIKQYVVLGKHLKDYIFGGEPVSVPYTPTRKDVFPSEKKLLKGEEFKQEIKNIFYG
jgi:hypothetical protein